VSPQIHTAVLPFGALHFTVTTVVGDTTEFSPSLCCPQNPAGSSGDDSSYVTALAPLTTIFTRASPTSALADLAPQLMQHRIINSDAFRSPSSISSSSASSPFSQMRLLLPSSRTRGRSATELAVVERAPELLRLPLLDDMEVVDDHNAVPLLEGFKATRPRVADGSRRRRRRTGSGGEVKGLLGGVPDETSAMENLHVGRRKKLGSRRSEATGRPRTELNRAELETELADATEDRHHVDVRRVGRFVCAPIVASRVVWLMLYCFSSFPVCLDGRD
jgi:hypothetical protein